METSAQPIKRRPWLMPSLLLGAAALSATLVIAAIADPVSPPATPGSSTLSAAPSLSAPSTPPPSSDLALVGVRDIAPAGSPAQVTPRPAARRDYTTACGATAPAPGMDEHNLLRWSFDPELGFPEGGFDLYRCCGTQTAPPSSSAGWIKLNTNARISPPLSNQQGMAFVNGNSLMPDQTRQVFAPSLSLAEWAAMCTSLKNINMLPPSTTCSMPSGVNPGNSDPNFNITQDDMQLLMLMSLRPEVATALGLYWVDDQGDQANCYYRLEGHWASGVREAITGPMENKPVDVPTGLMAGQRPDAGGSSCESLGGPTGVALQTELMATLNWAIPQISNVMTAAQTPILYNVCRQAPGQGTFIQINTREAELGGNTVTVESPVVVGRVPQYDDNGQQIMLPSGEPELDYPEIFFRDYFDGNPVVGQDYAYKVTGLDIFGRESLPSAPSTLPLTDSVGPPPPANLKASTEQPPSASTATVTLSFDWTSLEMATAPDASEFRIYRRIDIPDLGINCTCGNPASCPPQCRCPIPPQDDPSNWTEIGTVAITGYDHLYNSYNPLPGKPNTCSNNSSVVCLNNGDCPGGTCESNVIACTSNANCPSGDTCNLVLSTCTSTLSEDQSGLQAALPVQRYSFIDTLSLPPGPPVRHFYYRAVAFDAPTGNAGGPSGPVRGHVVDNNPATPPSAVTPLYSYAEWSGNVELHLLWEGVPAPEVDPLGYKLLRSARAPRCSPNTSNSTCPGPNCGSLQCPAESCGCQAQYEVCLSAGTAMGTCKTQLSTCTDDTFDASYCLRPNCVGGFCGGPDSGPSAHRQMDREALLTNGVIDYNNTGVLQETKKLKALVALNNLFQRDPVTGAPIPVTSAMLNAEIGPNTQYGTDVIPAKASGQVFFYRVMAVSRAGMDESDDSQPSTISSPFTVQVPDFVAPSQPQLSGAVAKPAEAAIELRWSVGVEPDTLAAPGGYTLYRGDIGKRPCEAVERNCCKTGTSNVPSAYAWLSPQACAAGGGSLIPEAKLTESAGSYCLEGPEAGLPCANANDCDGHTCTTAGEVYLNGVLIATKSGSTYTYTGAAGYCGGACVGGPIAGQACSRDHDCGGLVCSGDPTVSCTTQADCGPNLGNCYKASCSVPGLMCCEVPGTNGGAASDSWMLPADCAAAGGEAKASESIGDSGSYTPQSLVADRLYRFDIYRQTNAGSTGAAIATAVMLGQKPKTLTWQPLDALPATCSNSSQTPCATDNDCTLQTDCLLINGDCSHDASSCTSDADCGANNTCDSGACSHDASSCTSDADCGANNTCDNMAGTCSHSPVVSCTGPGDCQSTGSCTEAIVTLVVEKREADLIALHTAPALAANVPQTVDGLALLTDNFGSQVQTLRLRDIPPDTEHDYGYALKLSDQAGNVSPFSPPVMARTVDAIPPDAPTNLAVGRVQNGAYTGQSWLTWEHPEGDLKVRIKRSSKSIDGPWQTVARRARPLQVPDDQEIHVTGDPELFNVWSSGSTYRYRFRDPNAKPNRDYWYRVELYDAAGNKSSRDHGKTAMGAGD